MTKTLREIYYMMRSRSYSMIDESKVDILGHVVRVDEHSVKIWFSSDGFDRC